MSYKTGGKNIYFIINAGYNFSPKPLLIFGVGIGSSINISTNWKFRPELVWNSYHEKLLKNNQNSTNVTQLKFGIMRKLNEKLAITFIPGIFTSFKEKNGTNYGYEISQLKAFSSKMNSNSLKKFGIGLGIGFSFL